MQGPPSVEYPVAGSRLHGWLLTLLVVGWLVVQALWALSSWPSVPGGAWWVGLLAGLAGCFQAWWVYRNPVQGRLAWERGPAAQGKSTGRWAWYSTTYRRGTPVADLQAVLDLQHTLLLRLTNADGRVWWLWLERRIQPADWDDLRRALGYSRRR